MFHWTNEFTYVKELREELYDMLNYRTLSRQTKTFQEWTKGFVDSQIVEMERSINTFTNQLAKKLFKSKCAQRCILYVKPAIASSTAKKQTQNRPD